MDFTVYWTAAQKWVRGTSPYLFDAGDRGFVFKYPPWILPFFWPFGFLSLPASKIAWAGVELLCLFYSIGRLIRMEVAPRTALFTAALFWWIWLAHFFAGQFTIVLLACALWAVPEDGLFPKFRLSTLAIVFTAKVFSLISLVGLWRRYLSLRVVLWGIVSLAFLTLTAMEVLHARGNMTSISELLRQWTRSAASGGTELPAIVIRGQMNHGFTGGVLRALHVDPTQTYIDQCVALVLGAIFSWIWMRASRELRIEEAWAGWLGVGLIVHPLAWHHSFVLAYPLCAIAIDRAIRSKSKAILALALLGPVCIGILIPNVIGPTLVRPLELASVKSWGVVFAATALVLAERRSKTRFLQNA